MAIWRHLKDALGHLWCIATYKKDLTPGNNFSETNNSSTKINEIRIHFD